ncbi:MAG TPA: autotransporter assembly complex family protein [Pseudomonadales bacterium]|nr:autotransporter assembly complex family protein [Pseudomonadales bacterium]
MKPRYPLHLVLAGALSALLLCGANANADVVIDGVNADITRAIRANLTLPEGCGQSDWLVRYRYKNSQREIETTLQTFGYYSPVIVQQLVFETKCWKATFHIDPGPPVTIASANVAIEGEGKSLPAFTQLLAKSTLKVGNRFEQDSWEATKSDIERLASRLGFRQGKFVQHKASVDALHDTVAVDLVYDTGPRFHFGSTRFDTDLFDKSLLDRYVPYTRGEPFDGQKLGQMYQSLLDSGYFDDVIIDTSHVEGTDIDIRVSLVAARRARSHVGIGFSTDLGPSFSLGREVRRINRRGHQLKADLSLSPVQTKFAGSYRIPRSGGIGSWISIYGGTLQEQTETSKTSNSTLGIRRVLPRRNGWVETRFLEIANYRFDVAGQSSSTLTLVPGINISHTYSDSASARPQHAHALTAELSGTSRVLGSSVDYVSATGSAKVIQALTGRIRFIGRSRIGAVWSNDFDQLPPTTRFFAGGDTSVRGYDYNEIGAVDAAGAVVGGNRVIEGSAELDFAFHSNWGFAAFLDAGSVSLGHFSGTFERSAGIGIRWYSPIGPIRFDLAQPLNATDRGVKLHVSLGPDL